MSRTACPDVHNWQGLLEEGRTGGDPDELARHLETCAACQNTLETLAAGPAVWDDAAQALGDQARQAGPEPALRDLVERLKREQPPAGGTDDLSFLRPADKPGLLGLLGGYEVREVIGQGGMGVVLKAYEPGLHRLVAIKVLAPGLAGSATARRRFTREARAAAAVCHEHVVAVHCVHETDGLPYLVMQYVAGESLQQRLDRGGPLEVEEVVRIGYQAAAGLAAAHAQGLIHRDVKPANLLLEDGLAKVKITDFGLARMADDVGLTRAGVVAGTPEYMAPEQARGEVVDHRADLFSLGSVLYACCTGRAPFRGATPLAVLRRVSDETPAPIRSLNPEVPAWLEALVARLLAKEPAQRFQGAAEVATLLERYLAHLRQPATVPAPELPPPAAEGRPGLPEPRPRTGPVGRALQRLWLPALLLLTVLGLSLFLAAQLLPPGGRSQDEVAYDFRGRPLPPDMVPFGPLEDRFVKVEAEGLRISLPGDRDDILPVGLAMPLTVEGDFEITTAFEILQADEPAPGAKTYGVGVLMSVNQSARVGCLVRAQGQQVATWDHWATVEGSRRFLSGASPAAAKAGRLRLKRVGTTLHFLWAPETAGDHFEDIHQYDFGDHEITLLRLELNADVGRRPGALDLRLLDLKVRASTAVADQGLAPEGGRKTWSKGWLVAAGLSGLALLFSGLTVWACLSLRRRRRTGEAPDRAPAPGGQLNLGAAGPPISFPCPGCGKKLKAKADLAGKKVKCSHCGKAGVVPALLASPPPRPLT
jgi:serine/threonine-protein kinase